MSLITLTFGYGRERLKAFPDVWIKHPGDAEIPTDSANQLKVKKVCQFFGDTEVYVLGTVVSGVVGKCMQGKVNGKSFDVVDMECKYPDARYAKQGMNIGIFVKGIAREELANQDIIEFMPTGQQ